MSDDDENITPKDNWINESTDTRIRHCVIAFFVLVIVLQTPPAILFFSEIKNLLQYQKYCKEENQLEREYFNE